MNLADCLEQQAKLRKENTELKNSIAKYCHLLRGDTWDKSENLDAIKKLMSDLTLQDKKQEEENELKYKLQKTSFEANIDGRSYLDDFAEKGELLRLTAAFRRIISAGSVTRRRKTTSDVRYINTMTVQELRKLANPHARKLRQLNEKMEIHKVPLVIPIIDSLQIECDSESKNSTKEEIVSNNHNESDTTD